LFLFDGEPIMATRPDPDRESFWRELVARRESSGLTVAELCQRSGVSPASFFLWQRRLRKQQPRRRSGTIEALPRTSLVPVRIVPDRVDEDRMSPVVVELPGPVRVQIPPGCDAATIHAVLQAVSAPRFGGPSSC
jgi:transposase-like protein